MFVNLSVVSFKTTVPVAFGKVIVLSPSGSSTVNVVSCAFALPPSNTNDTPVFKNKLVFHLLIF